MDEYRGKRSVGKLDFSRRGSSLTFRDPNREDRNVQYCSRLGCSTRLNSMKGTQASDQEKIKYSKSSLRSISSKTIAESSSRSFSSSSESRKTHQGRRKQKSLQETVVAESSSREARNEALRFYNGHVLIDSESSSRGEETDDSEFSSVTSGIPTLLSNPEELESTIRHDSPLNTIEVLGNSTVASTSMSSRKQQINRELGSGKQYIPGVSVRRSPQRYGLKSLGCTSISDVLPSGCSSSGFSQSRRVDSLKKRPSNGENPSAIGAKGVSFSSSGSYSGSSHSPLSVQSRPQQTSRRGRNQATNKDGAVSVRTRRGGPFEETGRRLHEQEDDNIVFSPEANTISQLHQTQVSAPEDIPESSSRSRRRSATSSWTARNRTSSRLEDSNAQTLQSPSGSRDSYRRFHIEGIAEVLLALERIEQDEQLTYEHLLVLETNLFLGGLSLHDQHRDMRMDIDNMSYEELLALEEKMGDVSTALPEEVLSKCLKRSIYTRGSDDIKCSICQEEYTVGDEVGKLVCEHHYHVSCILHWLRQKNWCPICKASALGCCS